MKVRDAEFGQRVIRVVGPQAFIDRESVAELVQLGERRGLVVQRIAEVRLTRQRLIEPRQCVLVAPQGSQDNADIVAQAGIAGHKRVRLVAERERVLEAPEAREAGRAPLQGRNVVGLKSLADLETRESFLEAAKSMEVNRALARCVPVLRVEPERLLKAQDRLIVASERDQRVAEIAPEIGIIGLELDCLFKDLQGLLAPALPGQAGAEAGQIEGLRLLLDCP